MKKNKAFFLSALVLILNSCAEASDAPGTLGNTEVPMPTDAGNTEENTLPGTASAAPEPTVSGTNSIVTADTAIPFGESICADLDGDGVPEELTMRLLPDSASDNWRFARPELTVGETVFDGDYFSRLIGSGRFDAEAWYLLDIDRMDSSLELGLFREIIPQYAETVLFRYQSGELICIGSFAEKLLDSPLQFCQTGEPDWKAMKEAMPENIRTELVPGDGTICFLGACNILERDTAPVVWRLENGEKFQAVLVPAEQEVYEFQSWSEAGREKSLKEECRFYMKRDAGEEDTVLLPVGTKVRFRKYETNGNWIEMTYQDGTKEAWFQVVRTWESEGDTAVIRLPDGEMDAVSCFEGLQAEGG